MCWSEIESGKMPVIFERMYIYFFYFPYNQTDGYMCGWVQSFSARMSVIEFLQRCSELYLNVYVYTRDRTSTKSTRSRGARYRERGICVDIELLKILRKYTRAFFEGMNAAADWTLLQRLYVCVYGEKFSAIDSRAFWCFDYIRVYTLCRVAEIWDDKSALSCLYLRWIGFIDMATKVKIRWLRLINFFYRNADNN